MAFAVAVVPNMLISNSDNCAHNDNRIPFFVFCVIIIIIINKFICNSTELDSHIR